MATPSSEVREAFSAALEGGIPRLRLHRRHSAVNGTPVALSGDAATACLHGISGLPSVAGAEAANSASSFLANKCGAYLMVTDESSHKGVADAPLFDVALPMADAFIRVEASTGRSVIVLAVPHEDSEERDWWILLADGEQVGVTDEAATHRALWALGSAGAILSDAAASCEVEAESLGEGSSAVVHRAHIWKVFGEGSPTEVVVKISKKEPGEEQLSLQREVTALAAVQGHPNVVRMFGFMRMKPAIDATSSQPHRSLGLMMECCSGRDLFDEIVRAPFTEERGREVMQSILQALEHLESCGIIHRDVKADNVLLGDGGRLVLADFGIAAHYLDLKEMARKCGSPGHAAPEVFTGEGYDFKVDIFGLGVVLYFGLCGRLPFWGNSVQSTLRRTMRCEVKFESHQRFDNVTPRCKQFILGLLAKSPARRFSASEALCNVWITGEKEALLDLSEQETRPSTTLASFDVFDRPSVGERERPTFASNRPSFASMSCVSEPSDVSGLGGQAFRSCVSGLGGQAFSACASSSDVSGLSGQATSLGDSMHGGFHIQEPDSNKASARPTSRSPLTIMRHLRPAAFK
mmetsp:Transcript_57605/g.123895  ORF Transcript_57605/g.123895 Transcript_57605/m.123895 type:complete len:579 (+) Transcript_57605:256-1992(+)